MTQRANRRIRGLGPRLMRFGIIAALSSVALGILLGLLGTVTEPEAAGMMLTGVMLLVTLPSIIVVIIGLLITLASQLHKRMSRGSE
jgi:ABC-type dipeptide/oligopeptide/nickel transport system permease component